MQIPVRFLQCDKCQKVYVVITLEAQCPVCGAKRCSIADFVEVEVEIKKLELPQGYEVVMDY